MVPRSALIAPTLLLVTAVVAACGVAPTAPSPATGSASLSPIAQAPDPTPVLGPIATPAPTPASTPITGDVDGALSGPELTIEQVGDDSIIASLDAPEAKAWRLVVAGVGERGGERWEIVVETGDIGPIISATQVQGGVVTDVLDLTGFWDGTAAAGGCHATLPVCLDSEGFTLPSDGDGHFSVRLDLPEAQVPLVISGGIATWDGEPFVLGDWQDTEDFPWGEG